MKKQLKKGSVREVSLERQSGQFDKEAINLMIREVVIKNHSGENAETIFGKTDFEKAMTFTNNNSIVELRMDNIRNIIQEAIDMDRQRLSSNGEYRKFRYGEQAKLKEENTIEIPVWKEKNNGHGNESDSELSENHNTTSLTNTPLTDDDEN